jgi:STE24 endopeptidase
MIAGVRLNTILILFLALYALAIAVRLILYILNRRSLEKSGDKVPPEFAGVVTRETLRKMRDYTIATGTMGITEHIAYDLFLILVVLSGVLPWLTGAISSLGMNFVISGIVFFFLCYLALGIFEIPFDLYSTFVIEKRFSFSTITVGTWVSDLIKSLLVSAVLMGVFLAVFLSLITFAPGTWWIWSWLFFISFQLLVSWLYPVLIAPLFNKFEPIEDENLRERIRSLAQSAGIHVKGIYRMNALKRSRHSNAYFTGLGKSKRIVLFDTLLENHTPDEILSVLAHEMGHWKLGHVWKQLVVSSAVSLVLFYGAYLVVNSSLFYASFGFSVMALYAGLFVLSIFAKPAAFLLSPIGAMISRHFERQADDYAYAKIGSPDALISSLKELATHNLSNLHPDPFYAWFTYSHPPVVERIRRLENMEREVSASSA